MKLIAPLFLLFSMAVNADSIEPIETTLNDVERSMVAWIGEREAEIVSTLRTHVEINTGTENTAGLDQYRDLLAQDLESLGFATRTVSSEPLETLSCAGGKVEIADHLVATRAGEGPRLLLNGHMDTVFSADDEFQEMVIDGDGKIHGPGVADMKGGIVVMLYALRALAETGALDNTNLTVLLNTDEEIGSLGSRPLIEELAGEHDLGVVFEGSYQNQLTRARKGLGQARLKVTGRESHAGAAHQEGVSASLELAHKVIALEALTDYEAQSTVNVGVMAGGEKRNTVPGCADAYVDMRFTSEAEGIALLEQVQKVANTNTTKSRRFPDYPFSETWAVLHRPAKAMHPRVDALIAQAMGISAQIGEPIVGARYSGGGTDGSIAQAAGLPTIDSLGVDGLGAHSSRESTTVVSLIARSQLAAVMLLRLLQE